MTRDFSREKHGESNASLPLISVAKIDEVNISSL